MLFIPVPNYDYIWMVDGMCDFKLYSELKLVNLCPEAHSFTCTAEPFSREGQRAVFTATHSSQSASSDHCYYSVIS